MSTNQERRAEARQRLREQMEAQARREKQLKIIGASVVVVLLLALVGVVVWKKMEKQKAETHAANWTTCDYPASPNVPEKVDPKQFEQQGAEVVEQAKKFNTEIDTIAKKKKDGTAPTGEQAKKGTADVALTLNGKSVPLHLDRAKAPCNVASFVGLIEQKYFDESECHRLTVSDKPDGLSVLQCGDPTGTGMSGPGYSVKDELPTDLPPSSDGQGSVYPRGTLAMAKSQAPDSAGSQFFLVYKDSVLPPQYSVLGTIGAEGLDVLDAIAKDGVKSKDANSEDNQKPKNPVKLDKAVVTGQEGLPDKG